MNGIAKMLVDAREERRWSVFALVAANLLPLAGVLFWGWQIYEIVLVYWLENVILGVLNLPKLILASSNSKSKVSFFFEKVISIPFFCFHYGLFCLGHGAFIVQLLAPGGDLNGGKGVQLTSAFDLAEVLKDEFSILEWLAIGFFAASHLVSLFSNFIGRGEWRKWNTNDVMFMPYGRVILLHIAILVGGLVSLLLGSPIYLLFILVVGKTVIDLALHDYEHFGVESNTESEA